MPARKANSSGRWSQNIWDVTPSANDDVFANGFTVEIDQNITVQSLRTTLSSGYAVAGGGFTIFQPLTSVVASPNGFVAGTTTCITSFVSSGTVSLSGNVTGGSAAAAYGVANLSSANVSISGNILGGTNATAYGAFLDAAGTLTVTGNVSGSTNTVGIYNNNSSGFVYVNAPQIVVGGSNSGCHGIQNNSAGNCYITSPRIVGGTNTGADGIRNTGIGFILVNGNVEAGPAGSTAGVGITQSSTGTVFINGNLYASQISTGGNHALVSANAAARNEITGAIFNADGGRQAIYATRYLVRPKVFDSFTFHKNTEITNLFLNSENFASWTLLSGTTVTPNITGIPTSNTILSADFLVDTPGVANSHFVRQAVSTTLSTANVPNTLVFSIYGKPVQRRYVVIGIDSAPTFNGTTYNGTSAFSVVFDLSAGTTLAQKSTGSASLTLSSIENAGNGWWRCMVQGRINNSSATWNTAPFVAISDRTDYSAPVASEHYPLYAAVNTLTAVALWGAQYEYTSMTPYVSTTTTQGYGNRPTSPPFFYYSPEAYGLSYVPQASSVRIGTTYAAVSTLSGQTLNIAAQLTGTMSVPNPSVVSYGTLVDHTSGTALNSSQSVLTLWNTQISTLTADNLIGTRLANVATFMDVGSALETLKY